MKIMISQPMRGKTNKEIKIERAELVKQLEKEGHEVLDTVFENAPADADIAVYMLGKSIEFLSKADAVVFMQGWESARGCKIEYEVSLKYGKFIKCL